MRIELDAAGCREGHGQRLGRAVAPRLSARTMALQFTLVVRNLSAVGCDVS